MVSKFDNFGERPERRDDEERRTTGGAKAKESASGLPKENRLERVQENLPITKKRLFLYPFTYVPDLKSKEHKWEQVPAVFQVRRENRHLGLVLLADRNGKEIGWTETSESFAWDTRVTLRPGTAGRGEKRGLTLARREQGALDRRGDLRKIELTSAEELDFPILCTKTVGGRRLAQVGPPLQEPTKDYGVGFPAWVVLDRSSSLGVVVGTEESTDYLLRQEYLHRQLARMSEPAKRQGLDKLLDTLNGDCLALVSGQAPKEVASAGAVEEGLWWMNGEFGIQFCPLQDVKSFRSEEFESFLASLRMKKLWRERAVAWKRANEVDRRRLERTWLAADLEVFKRREQFRARGGPTEKEVKEEESRILNDIRSLAETTHECPLLVPGETEQKRVVLPLRLLNVN